MQNDTPQTDKSELMPETLPIKLVDNENSVTHGMYICAAGETPYLRQDVHEITTTLMASQIEKFARIISDLRAENTALNKIIEDRDAEVNSLLNDIMYLHIEINSHYDLD